MKESKAPHGSCRACGNVRPLTEMRPVVDRAPIDLDTLLRSSLLCADAYADECRARACGQFRKIFLAMESAETWAGGNVHLVTDDPRRAEEHAAAVGGVTAALFVHSDYRRN